MPPSTTTSPSTKQIPKHRVEVEVGHLERRQRIRLHIPRSGDDRTICERRPVPSSTGCGRGPGKPGSVLVPGGVVPGFLVRGHWSATRPASPYGERTPTTTTTDEGTTTAYAATSTRGPGRSSGWSCLLASCSRIGVGIEPIAAGVVHVPPLGVGQRRTYGRGGCRTRIWGLRQATSPHTVPPADSPHEVRPPVACHQLVSAPNSSITIQLLDREIWEVEGRPGDRTRHHVSTHPPPHDSLGVVEVVQEAHPPPRRILGQRMLMH